MALDSIGRLTYEPFADDETTESRIDSLSKLNVAMDIYPTRELDLHQMKCCYMFPSGSREWVQVYSEEFEKNIQVPRSSEWHNLASILENVLLLHSGKISFERSLIPDKIAAEKHAIIVSGEFTYEFLMPTKDEVALFGSRLPKEYLEK